MAFDFPFNGVQVMPWLFQPDGEVLERLEWLTDVQLAFEASEQRSRLREYPRRGFEFGTTLEGRERQTAENILFNWQAQPFMVPVWMDGERLTASVAPAATSVPADTATRDYAAGNLVALWASPFSYEIAEIQAVNANSLDLVDPLVSGWPAWTTVMLPLRMARMPDAQSLSRFTGAAALGRLRFDCVDLSAGVAATETSYRGTPVLTSPPNWTEDVTQEYQRKLMQFDPRVGQRFWDEEGSGAILLQSHRWLLDGRAQIHAFRQWLYARKGRLTAFWLPSWACDLTVSVAIASADTTIDVEHCGYTHNVAQGIARRDVRILLTDGTVFYRRVTGSVEVDADTERLTIDSALGQDVAVADVAAVSWMAPVRLDADTAEINWWTWQHAEAALMTRGFRNDL